MIARLQSTNVDVHVIKSGIGEPTESDVDAAAASGGPCSW